MPERMHMVCDHILFAEPGRAACDPEVAWMKVSPLKRFSFALCVCRAAGKL